MLLGRSRHIGRLLLCNDKLTGNGGGLCYNRGRLKQNLLLLLRLQIVLLGCTCCAGSDCIF